MRWIVYGGLGLTLATPEGTRTVEVASAADAREASAGTNGVTVLLAVKSHQIDAAIEDLTAALPASTPVVSVQNGVSNEPTLLRFFDDVQGVCQACSLPVAGGERSGGSSWQSLRRGAGTIETDYLNGEVVRLGRTHGVLTPVNALLQRTARRMAAEGSATGSIDAATLLAEVT